MGDTKKVAVLIMADPYQSSSCFVGLRFALQCLVNEMEVSVLLIESGVLAAQKNQSPMGTYNIQEWIENILDADGIVKVCGACAKARGTVDTMLDGCEMTSMSEVVAICAAADMQMVF